MFVGVGLLSACPVPVFFAPAYSEYFSLTTKVSLSYEEAFANRTIRLSNCTKVTDYITACGKIDVQTQKIPAIQ